MRFFLGHFPQHFFDYFRIKEVWYWFSDCCNRVHVHYTNDETIKYNNVLSGIAFTVFEREEGTTNERDHYKSVDGKYSIDYSDCGGWSIGVDAIR